MNSLVVLFSVMAIAAAAPSGVPVLSYVAPQAAIVAGPSVWAPTAYAAAPIAAVAPAAVSSQSRIDIKSTPAVVSSITTGPVVSSYGAVSPVVYSSPISSIYAPSPIAAVPNIFRSAVVAVNPVVDASSVQAAEQPQAVTETPEVAAARAAHEEAKATIVNEAHSVQKRDVLYTGSPAIAYAASPVVHTYPTSHLVYSAPVAHVPAYNVHAPVIARVL